MAARVVETATVGWVVETAVEANRSSDGDARDGSGPRETAKVDRWQRQERRGRGVIVVILTSFEVLGGHKATAMQRALSGHANTARAPTVRSQPLHRVVRPSLHAA